MSVKQLRSFTMALVLIAIGWAIGYLLRAQLSPVPWAIPGSFIGLGLVLAWQLRTGRLHRSILLAGALGVMFALATPHVSITFGQLALAQDAGMSANQGVDVGQAGQVGGQIGAGVGSGVGTMAGNPGLGAAVGGATGTVIGSGLAVGIDSMSPGAQQNTLDGQTGMAGMISGGVGSAGGMSSGGSSNGNGGQGAAGNGSGGIGG